MNILFIILFGILFYLVIDIFRINKELDQLIDELFEIVEEYSEHPDLLLKNYNKITENLDGRV